jgi:sugar phosphate isomerase/epimerase
VARFDEELETTENGTPIPCCGFRLPGGSQIVSRLPAEGGSHKVGLFDEGHMARDTLNRRDFFKTAGAGVVATSVMMTPREAALAQDAAQKAALDRIASNSYPIRPLFKQRGGPGGAGRAGAPAGAAGGGGGRGAGQPGAGGRGGAGTNEPEDLASNPNAKRPLAIAEAAAAARAGLPNAQQMKEKYGEITMLDFPQFTKDTFPGVTRMDIFSSLFGDVTDETMFFPGPNGRPGGFDPLSPSGRKWLDQLANALVKTGTKVQHISNNAPTNLAAYGSPEEDEKRKAGVAMAKRWLEGCAVLGVKSMRMNSPQALGPSIRPNAIARGPGDGYPRNIDIVPLMAAAIESYKEMADFGGKLSIRVTLENHWGLAADPMNIRTIIDEVKNPFCEASPDFCNWEHEYMLFNGLKALAPHSHTNVHAKYWDRWGELNDVQRSTRIMLDGGFEGTFALEYEQGPLNGVEGAKYLYKEVLAALTTRKTA